MIQLLTRLFETQNIQYTRKGLERTIRETPYNPSLISVSHILSKYNISHPCVEFMNKEDITEDECPCFIVFENGFAIVESITNESVTLYVQQKGLIEISRDVFLKKWNGVAMLVKPDKQSGEMYYDYRHKAQQKFRLKSAALVSALVVMSLIAAIFNPLAGRWVLWVALAINLLGVGVAYLLLQKQLHIPNKFADKLCGIAKESHCENVTDSDGGSLFGLVKLSEVGGGYFLVNTIALLFAPGTLFYLAVVSVCVLPFSFWSIWYQKYKAKSWCVLCLCTLALMWTQAIVYTAGGAFSQPGTQPIFVISLIAGYVVAVLSINRIMGWLDAKRIGDIWRTEFNRLKLDDTVVTAFESDAAIFDTDTENCTSLIFGDPNATNCITVLSNPYCVPCAQMHERIKNIPGSAVSVKYVFAFFPSRGDRMNRYLIAAYLQLGAERTWELMTEWYSGGKEKGEEFFSGLGLNPDSDAVNREIEKHAKWRSDDRLYGTPTVLINGREIVYPYNVEDYMYLTQL